MDRKEFGRLIVALREEHLTVKHKRVWSSKDLADKSGIPIKTIKKIEDGEQKKIEKYLPALVSALKLSSREEREFYVAAVEATKESDNIETGEKKRSVSPERAYKELKSLIKSIVFPCFIIDTYGDIVAANRQAMFLLNTPMDQIESARSIPGGFNLMRMVFSDEFRLVELFGEKRTAWERIAKSNIFYFRAMTLKVRHTPYLQAVLHYLLTDKHTEKGFGTYWRHIETSDEDNYTDTDYYEYSHPRWGRVSYFAVTTITLTSAGELHTVIYVPAGVYSKNTVDIFMKLYKKFKKEDIVDLARWPRKPNIIKWRY